MCKSCSNEASLHIADNFLGWDGWDVISGPSFSQRFSEQVEVRVAFADLEAADHVIADHFISDIVIVFHRLLDAKFFPS